MRVVRQMFLLLVGVLVFGGSLSARTVEIWPGMFTINNKVIRHSVIANNLAAYTLDNNGNLILLPNEINKKYVALNLLNISSFFLNKSAKNLKTDLSTIKKNYNKYKDIFDPVSWFFKILISATNNKDIQNASNMFVFKEVINGAMGKTVELIMEKIKKHKKITKSALVDALAEIIAKDLIVKGFFGKYIDKSKDLTNSFLSNEGVHYILEKIVSLSIDLSYIAKETGVKFKGSNLQYVADNSIWTRFTNILEIINGISNITNTTYALNSTIDSTTNTSIHLYAHLFIIDYLYKFNFNINKMADYIKQHGMPKKFKFLENKTPKTFFQLFVLYGLSKGYIYNEDEQNTFLNNLFGVPHMNIDIYNSKNMVSLFIMAHEVLNLIRKYGDGGNYKIYLDINKTGKVNIDKKSYSLNPLYWMIPLRLYNDNKNKFISFPTQTILENIPNINTVDIVKNFYDSTNYIDDKIFMSNKREYSRITNTQPTIYVQNKNYMVKFNPFFNYQKYKTIINNYKKNNKLNIKLLIADNNAKYGQGDIIKSIQPAINKDLINRLNYDKAKLILNNLVKISIENKNIDKFVVSKIIKKINYRSISFDNNKEIEYTNIYNCRVKNKNIIYFDKGYISDCNLVNSSALKMPINMKLLKRILYNFSFLQKGKIPIVTYSNVSNILKLISWTSPIKREQFFKFLVKLLKIDTTSHYSADFSNAYPNIFKKSNGMCFDTTLEGCALRNKGISTGSNPDGTLTLFQVLLTLDKIENAYKRTQK